MVFDGDPGDTVHPGQETIEGGEFIDNVFGSAQAPEGAQVTRRTEPQYVVTIRTGTNLEQMRTIRYGDTQYFDQETVGNGRPILEVAYQRPGTQQTSPCVPEGTGAFTVHEFNVDASRNLTRLTVSFEQTCEGATGTLRGCLHYSP